MSDKVSRWVNFTIRPLETSDRVMVDEFIAGHWGSPEVAANGRLLRPSQFPGFAAEMDGQIIGLITYRLEKAECEIISLNSLKPGKGIGSALIAAVRTQAAKAGCQRLWLVTTNDNLQALSFYQKLGLRLAALYAGAVDLDRLSLKPQIPLTGENGISIHDYLELEMNLKS
jgi:GNAT superfamily N-acetyltransferase